jgi:hypothetical protein
MSLDVAGTRSMRWYERQAPEDLADERDAEEFQNRLADHCDALLDERREREIPKE